MRPINRSSLPHLVDCTINWLRIRLHTPLALALARWWGINIGAGCRFYGLPLFRRLPDSSIRIGSGCEFRSSQRSNLAGVNRRCSIATVGERARIEIGDDCGFSGTVIGAASEIVLGKRVMVGANSTITDTDWHPIDPAARAAGAVGPCAPIRIEDDVWLGMHVTVLKGVTIGARTTVAANSLVMHSLPPGVVAAGIPARVIKQIDPVEPR
jgi:acetyltransferase-like isoleucine patch superfamily enzyme